MTTKTQYSVQYSCDNCGWSGALKFNIGKPAPGESACPKCHCVTARKQITLPFVPKRRTKPVDPYPDPVLPLPMPLPNPDPWRDNRWWPPNPRIEPPCDPIKYEERSGNPLRRQPTGTRNDADHCTGFGFES